MRRHAITLAAMAALGLAALGYTALAVSRTTQEPAPGPDPITVTNVDSILSAIEENLWNVDSISADLEGMCSTQAMSFVDGFVAARGQGDMHVDMGTSGFLFWHNDTVLNFIHPQYSGVNGMRWDWPDADRNASSLWASLVGLIDPRVILTFALFDFAPLTLNSGIESVNGIGCYRLQGDQMRLWVDSSALHRIIRCEIDHHPDLGGGLRIRTDFDGWANVGNQADLPDTIYCEHFEPNGDLRRSWVYMLSNIQVSVALDDVLFQTTNP